MCSELTPRAPIQDSRIAQFMQPCLAYAQGTKRPSMPLSICMCTYNLWKILLNRKIKHCYAQWTQKPLFLLVHLRSGWFPKGARLTDGLWFLMCYHKAICLHRLRSPTIGLVCSFRKETQFRQFKPHELATFRAIYGLQHQWLCTSGGERVLACEQKTSYETHLHEHWAVYFVD